MRCRPRARASRGRVQPTSVEESGTSIAEAERRLIQATLEHFDGDKKRAAESSRISLKTLYNRLGEYRAAEATAAGEIGEGEGRAGPA